MTTAAALLLATGCSGADDHRSGQAPRAATSQSPGPVSRPAPAGPDTLAGFDTCDALLAWYVDRSVSEVGPYGWDDVYGGEFLRGAYAGVANLSGPWLDSRADLALPRSGVLDSTGTNTQEADVDEPDTDKTDGHLVVRVVDDARLVLTDVSTDTPRVTARLPLPTGGYGSELLLAGDHVLVTQQYAGEQGPRRLRGPTPVDVAPDRTRLVDIDISDPSAPEVLHQDLYSGGQVSVRRYGATVRLVTSTGRPQLAFTHPGKHLTAREATGRNRALVRASTIEDWLPTVTTDGVRTRLVGCDQVL
ncbi:MAG: beta-propeller domain-containing protein, partial [Marmoricola sp.]